MNNQILFIYELKSLYDIFTEIEENLNFKVIYLNKKEISEINFKDYRDHLILSLKDLKLPNMILVENFPIKFSKLLERINIEFLKQQFNSQSELKINQYIIDLNSRELLLNGSKLKLTEKEINIIIYISKSNKPVSINELQDKVWSYQSDIETHTVETHIYRLRKKILNKFSDNEFIISKKDGYQIK